MVDRLRNDLLSRSRGPEDQDRDLCKLLRRRCDLDQPSNLLRRSRLALEGLPPIDAVDALLGDSKVGFGLGFVREPVEALTVLVNVPRSLGSEFIIDVGRHAEEMEAAALALLCLAKKVIDTLHEVGSRLVVPLERHRLRALEVLGQALSDVPRLEA